MVKIPFQRKNFFVVVALNLLLGKSDNGKGASLEGEKILSLDHLQPRQEHKLVSTCWWKARVSSKHTKSGSKGRIDLLFHALSYCPVSSPRVQTSQGFLPPYFHFKVEAMEKSQNVPFSCLLQLLSPWI